MLRPLRGWLERVRDATGPVSQAWLGAVKMLCVANLLFLSAGNRKMLTLASCASAPLLWLPQVWEASPRGRGARGGCSKPYPRSTCWEDANPGSGTKGLLLTQKNMSRILTPPNAFERSNCLAAIILGGLTNRMGAL